MSTSIHFNSLSLGHLSSIPVGSLFKTHLYGGYFRKAHSGCFAVTYYASGFRLRVFQLPNQPVWYATEFNVISPQGQASLFN